MVYSGKPSLACRTCRQRRVRCDELRPSCTQCVKTRRECQGYPDANDALLQHRTRKPQRLNGRRGSRSPASTPESDVTDGSSPESSTSIFIANPPASVKTAAACFFLDGILVTPLSSGRNVGHLEYVPKFYLNAMPSSTLAICTDALSLAAFSSFGREDGAITTEAHQCYGQAVMSLHKDLTNPIMLQQNETLMSTLVMLAVESLLAKTKAPAEQWSAHVFGAVRLLMTRGQAVFKDPIACRLYNVTRRYLENGTRERGGHLPPFFEQPAIVQSPRSSMELNTIAVLNSMADLRRRVSIALQIEETDNTENLHELVLECQRSDQIVLQWIDNLPYEYLYDIVPSLPGAEPDFPFAIPRHQYKDPHSHRLWNSYRCTRICLNVYAYRCLDKLSGLEYLDYTTDIALCLSNAQIVANEICQSLPTAFFKARTTTSMNTKQDITSAITAYSLLWPFYLAQNVPTAPLIQKRWIRSNMIEIADRYELRHAMVLVDAMDKDPDRPLFTPVWRADAIEYVWEYNFMYSSGAV